MGIAIISLELVVATGVNIYGMNNKSKSKISLIASSSPLAGLFAFIGASCCVLPFILLNLGVSTAIIAHLEFFARGKYWFLALALALILAGVFMAYRNGRRPSRRTLVFLVLAALPVIGALILPFFEGDLLRWLKQK